MVIRKLVGRVSMVRLLLAGLLLAGFGIVLILVQREVRFSLRAATSEKVRVFVSPEATTLPPDQSLTVRLDTKGKKVVFADLVVEFDASKVQLKNEVELGPVLNRVIVKTEKGEANSTGKIRVAVGLDPLTRANPVVGEILIASLKFDSNTSQSDTSTVVGINGVQVVDIEARELLFESGGSILTLNPVLPTNSPTPTRTPTPAPLVSTATPIPTNAPGSFTFGAAGDIGGRTYRGGVVLTEVAKNNLNFFLALGDLSYNHVTPESAWCDFVKGYVGSSFPFELVAGNHEDSGPDGNIINFANCLPNRISGMVGKYAREFYFDYPQSLPLARFIMISPGLDFSDDSEGYYSYSSGVHRTWLVNAIDSARAAGIGWIIVGKHYPCIVMGLGCDSGTEVMNLLLEKKVDLVLEGHKHGVQISKLLGKAGSSNCVSSPSFYPSVCIVNSTTSSGRTYTKGQGTIFYMVGSGGASLTSFDLSDPEQVYFARWSGSSFNPTHGFAKINVTSNRLQVDFIKAPVTAANGGGGNFSDSFAIAPSSSPNASPSPTRTPTPTPLVSTATPPPTQPPIGDGTCFLNGFARVDCGGFDSLTDSDNYTNEFILNQVRAGNRNIAAGGAWWGPTDKFYENQVWVVNRSIFPERKRFNSGDVITQSMTCLKPGKYPAKGTAKNTLSGSHNLVIQRSGGSYRSLSQNTVENFVNMTLTAEGGADSYELRTRCLAKEGSTNNFGDGSAASGDGLQVNINQVIWFNRDPGTGGTGAAHHPVLPATAYDILDAHAWYEKLGYAYATIHGARDEGRGNLSPIQLLGGTVKGNLTVYGFGSRGTSTSTDRLSTVHHIELRIDQNGEDYTAQRLFVPATELGGIGSPWTSRQAMTLDTRKVTDGWHILSWHAHIIDHQNPFPRDGKQLASEIKIPICVANNNPAAC